MLTKAQIENILTLTLSTGADFAEVFFENTVENKLIYAQNKLESSSSSKILGVGIRALKDLQCVYASSSDTSYKTLCNLACKLSQSIHGASNKNSIHLTHYGVKDISPILVPPTTYPIKNKINILRNVHNKALDYHTNIKLVNATLLDVTSNIIIANSTGLLKEDSRTKTRLYLNVTASDGHKNQSITEGPGASLGMELFDKIDIEKIATETSNSAFSMLSAQNCPSGKMPVAIEGGFGGVIFHEACGHSLEGEQVAQDNSEFCGMLNKKIANEKVTAIDDGTIPNGWGSMSIDDDGRKSQRNTLIKDGVLKSYMLDSLNAQRLSLISTGNSRRQNYKFAPTSRMTNTYIEAGNDSMEDIIKSIDYGIYAKKMGGGQVNTITGDFNFSVAQGYLIEKGKIAYPVMGASLIGKGSNTLMNIDMVSNNLTLAQGMCGSVSGSIPTNIGQPLIRVREITVGGK